MQSESRSLSLVCPQDSSVAADGSQPASSLADKGVNILSFVPVKKQQAVSKFVSITTIPICCHSRPVVLVITVAPFWPLSQDLGLSTARGRGRCKNPSCDYMYKNRHKPAVCPKCGWELAQKNGKAAKVRTDLLTLWDCFPAGWLNP